MPQFRRNLWVEMCSSVGAGFFNEAAMQDALSSYHRRQESVRRKHARMAHGYVTKLDKRTGNFVQVPDKKTSRVSLKIILWTAVLFVGFKVLLLTGLGAEAYNGHVASLSQGTAYERAGAWFMQIDPITAQLSSIVSLGVSRH